MSAETKYQEITQKMHEGIEKSIREACERIHSEIIPYINDDTEFNAAHRAGDIVNSIIKGEFEVSDSGDITCQGWRLRLTSSDYDKAVDALASKAGDAAKDKKIERLENRIKEMSEGIDWQ